MDQQQYEEDRDCLHKYQDDDVGCVAMFLDGNNN